MSQRSQFAVTRRVVVFTLFVFAGITQVPAQKPPQTTARSPDSPFVRRDQVKLTLTGAELIIATSRSKASEIGVKVNISVVDEGGHLLAFVRMDGARPASVYTSMTKATSAATKLGDTGPLPNSESPNTHHSLAVENAAANSGGKFTTLKGGVAIVVGGQVIGAVGVGGATGEQDAQVARAGVNALLMELNMTDSTPNQSKPGDLPPALFQNWVVEDIEGRGVVDRAQTTIQINKDGTAHGNTGVNLFNASPTISGNKITFGDFPVTRRAGPPALMDQESKFLAAIQKVKRYQIDNNQVLHLLDENGKELLRLSLLK